MRPARAARFALVLAGLLTGAPPAWAARMIVLGVDGMDPQLLRGFLAEGIMPNTARLAASGSFSELGTSTPPLSPVAWSNFITGLDPGGHGIFDFIRFDRRTLGTAMSVAGMTDARLPALPLGRFQLPLGASQPRLLRRGRAFWEWLEEAGVPAVIFQVPANYPPAADGTSSVSGMGTPDLRGTPGLSVRLTTDPAAADSQTASAVVRRVTVDDAGVISADLDGPPNAFLRKPEPTRAPFTVTLDPERPVALVDFGTDRALLNQGEWSPWLRARFDMVPGLVTVPGMVRVLIQEFAPHFQMYVTPINVDPRDAALPIASPASYARELAAAAGPFYTKEMPDAAKALQDGLLQPGEFLAQSATVMDERRRLLAFELERFREAPGDRFLFFYLSSLDLRHHMMQRYADASHPNFDPDANVALANAVRETYREMDALVGRVLDAAGPQDVVVVMSDHGFAPFRRQAHLNRWLEVQGLLRLQQPVRRRALDDWRRGVDWSRTRAYAVGLNGLNINVKGREPYGSVEPADRQDAARAIVARLAQWRDPLTRGPVVTAAALREDIYTGVHVEDAPDILVGYARGYRASWATTRGEVPEPLLEDNNEEWSGDHAMDAAAVPGVLLVNRSLRQTSADLRDLPVTILAHFGIAAPDGLAGRVIF